MLTPDFQTDFYDFKLKELHLNFIKPKELFSVTNHETIEYGCKLFLFHLENNNLDFDKNDRLFNSMKDLFHEILDFYYIFLEHKESLLSEKTIKLIDKVIKETIDSSFFGTIFMISVEENYFFLKKQEKIFGKKNERRYKLNQKFKKLLGLLKHVKNEDNRDTYYSSFINDNNLSRTEFFDLLKSKEDIEGFFSLLKDKDIFFKNYFKNKGGISFFNIHSDSCVELENNPEYYLLYRMLEQMDDNSMNLNYEKTTALFLKSESIYFKNTKLIKEVYRVIDKEQIKNMLKNKNSLDYLEFLSFFKIISIKQIIKDVLDLDVDFSFNKSKILLEYFDSDSQMFISKLANYNHEKFRSLVVNIANEGLFEIVDQKIVLSEDNKNFIELSFSY